MIGAPKFYDTTLGRIADWHSHHSHPANPMYWVQLHTPKILQGWSTNQNKFCHSSLVTCSWFNSFNTTGFISGHLSTNLMLPCPLNKAEVPAIPSTELICPKIQLNFAESDLAVGKDRQYKIISHVNHAHNGRG